MRSGAALLGVVGRNPWLPLLVELCSKDARAPAAAWRRLAEPAVLLLSVSSKFPLLLSALAETCSAWVSEGSA